jgi:hypothetical protein
VVAAAEERRTHDPFTHGDATRINGEGGLRVIFRWCSSSCSIEVGPLELLDEVSALFPGGKVVESSPGPVDVHVTRNESGFVVTPDTGETLRRPCDAISAVEYAVTMHLLSSDNHHAHLHAAAALTPRGAILALGGSGAGKSTLAYTWAHRGLPVFGDDVVPLDPEGRVQVFPRLLKVDPKHLRSRGEAPERTLGWDPEADDLWWSPIDHGGWAKGGATPVIVAEIQFQDGVELRLDPVEGGERLRLLLNAVQTTGSPPEECIDRLIRVTETAKIVRLQFGCPNEAASLLSELSGGVHAD